MTGAMFRPLSGRDGDHCMLAYCTLRAWLSCGYCSAPHPTIYPCRDTGVAHLGGLDFSVPETTQWGTGGQAVRAFQAQKQGQHTAWKRSHSDAAPGQGGFSAGSEAGSMSWQLVSFLLALSCIVGAFVHWCAHVFVCSSATAMHTCVLREILHPDIFHHPYAVSTC